MLTKDMLLFIIIDRTKAEQDISKAKQTHNKVRAKNSEYYIKSRVIGIDVHKK